MKIQDALKTWLLENKHEFTEDWETTGWCSDSGTGYSGTEHLELDMDKLFTQIDIFCTKFEKNKLAWTDFEDDK